MFCYGTVYVLLLMYNNDKAFGLDLFNLNLILK